jgi:hypothetical protein
MQGQHYKMLITGLPRSPSNNYRNMKCILFSNDETLLRFSPQQSAPKTRKVHLRTAKVSGYRDLLPLVPLFYFIEKRIT